MNKILTELEWYIDYYVGFIMTNGNKIHVYHDHMIRKWGKKYIEQLDMKQQTIQVIESPRYTDVYIECPYCQHSEQHPADEQRHHIQTFDIVEWAKDVPDQPEVSVMKCHVCKEEFELIWDYTKVEQVDDED